MPIGRASLSGDEQFVFDRVLARFYSHCQLRRIAVEQLFSQFDPLKTGLITVPQLRRAMTSSGLRFFDDEFNVVAKAFRDSTKPDMVLYEKFLEAFHTTREGQYPRVLRSELLRPEDEETFYGVLQRISVRLHGSKESIESHFVKYDQHHIGRVRKEDFIAGFPVKLTEAEMDLLLEKYMDKEVKDVNYRTFAKELREMGGDEAYIEDMLLPPLRPLTLVEMKVREFLRNRRINARHLFQPFDHSRRHLLSQQLFDRCLRSSGLEIVDEDLMDLRSNFCHPPDVDEAKARMKQRVLEKGEEYIRAMLLSYTSTVRVNYMAFCDQVETEEESVKEIAQTVLRRIQRDCCQRGPRSLHALSLALRKKSVQEDEGRRGRELLAASDLAHALALGGFRVTEDENRALVSFFDPQLEGIRGPPPGFATAISKAGPHAPVPRLSKSVLDGGQVSIRPLLQALEPALPERRRRAVQATFEQIVRRFADSAIGYDPADVDADASAALVPLAALLSHSSGFDPKAHPLVREGLLKGNDVKEEFVSSIEFLCQTRFPEVAERREGMCLHLSLFLCYYAFESVHIDRDTHFMAILRGCWAAELQDAL